MSNALSTNNNTNSNNTNNNTNNNNNNNNRNCEEGRNENCLCCRIVCEPPIRRDPCCRRDRFGEGGGYGYGGGRDGGYGGWGGGGWGLGWGGGCFTTGLGYGNGSWGGDCCTRGYCDDFLWETSITDRCLPGKPAAKMLCNFGYNYARRSGQQWSDKLHDTGAYSAWT